MCHRYMYRCMGCFPTAAATMDSLGQPGLIRRAALCTSQLFHCRRSNQVLGAAPSAPQAAAAMLVCTGAAGITASIRTACRQHAQRICMRGALLLEGAHHLQESVISDDEGLGVLARTQLCEQLLAGCCSGVQSRQHDERGELACWQATLGLTAACSDGRGGGRGRGPRGRLASKRQLLGGCCGSLQPNQHDKCSATAGHAANCVWMGGGSGRCRGVLCCAVGGRCWQHGRRPSTGGLAPLAVVGKGGQTTLCFDSQRPPAGDSAAERPLRPEGEQAGIPAGMARTCQQHKRVAQQADRLRVQGANAAPQCRRQLCRPLLARGSKCLA